MLQENKTKTNIGVGLGIIFQIAGRLVYYKSSPLLGAILMLVGAVFFIWGCMNYAEGKGYPMWLGLLGLFSCLGLIVLVVLPDKNK